MRYKDNKKDNNLIFLYDFKWFSNAKNRIKSLSMASYGFLIIFFQNGLSLQYKRF